MESPIMAANRIDDTYDEHHFLPQLGFGSDVNFENIVRYHRYLFRIYTPKSLPNVEDDAVFFVGARFNNTFAPQTPVISEMYSTPGDPLSETATYADCIQHLSWETRSTSPFISASFSFAWALWDAVRRFQNGVKHDVEIAVIDAASLSGRAVTTLQLLRKGPSSERDSRHWKWCRFASESQSVLIHGFVPRSAVINSIPLLSVIQNLPTYFLKSSPHHIRAADLSLDQTLAWDFHHRGSNYRRFCEEMGDRFTRMPFPTRVREIAVGSVRLAITLLSPWFYQTLAKDTQLAVTRTRELSVLIAHWPEQPGSRDYTEMASLMKALVQLLAEEVRGNGTRQAVTEVPRLREIIDNLQQEVIRIQQSQREHPIWVSGEEEAKHESLSSDSESDYSAKTFVEAVSSGHESPASHRGPLKIMIPDSPVVSSSSTAPSSASPSTPRSDGSDSIEAFTSPTPIKMGVPRPSTPPSPDFSSVRESSPPLSPLLLAAAFPSPPTTPLRLTIPLVYPESAVASSPSPQYYSAISPPPEFLLENSSLSSFISSSSSGRYTISDRDEDTDEERDCDESILREAVSYAVTGFVVGAFITLCLLSSQRRTLLYLT